VVFAGTVPAAAFDRLADAGITVETRRESEGVIHLRLRHPAWGRADLRFPVQPPHPQLLEWDPRLTPQEKSTARHAGWAARVDLESPVGDVLRDRKQLLRYLRAVSGEDAVVAMDLTSETFWPPAALEDELSHDAELDIEALFSLHLIHEPPTGTPYWLHSHGLREMGFTDFDVLDPHPEVVSRGSDLLRAIAFAIVEGRLAAGGATVEVADGLKLRLVPVRQALGRMDPGAFLLWRRDVDETHTEGHGLLCDPASGLFGRRREQPRPAAFFKAPLTREPLILFSTEASALMARRARDTYSMLRTMAAELAGYDLPVLVKLAYAMDRRPEDREHLWFQVHALEDEHVDATLVNEPAGISRLRVGDRGTHPVDLLSDWAVMTPFGMINPRWTVAWRRIRQDPEDFREAVRRAQP
jgi:hypothetical protein